MKIKRSIFFFFIINIIILTIPVNIYSQSLVISPSLVLDIIGSDPYYSNSNGFYNPYEIFIYENLFIEDYQLLRIPSVFDPYLHYGGYMVNPSLDYDKNQFFNYNSYWSPDGDTLFRYNFSLNYPYGWNVSNNYPFNSWYYDFYNPNKNQKKQSTDKESEEKESTDENSIFNGAAKIITENDNGGIFTFHVGDEFVVYFQIDTWEGPFFSRHRDHWLEEEEIKPENGYGIEKVENNVIESSPGWGYLVLEEMDNYYYRYIAIEPGENELLFNCYRLSFYTEGSNAWQWILGGSFDTFTITINIID